MSTQFELVTLKSGIKSLRLIDNNETFHPVVGPLVEANSLHVNQQNLVQRCAKPGKFVIWDVGLGAAANALAAIQALKGCAASVEMHSFDATTAPLSFALTHAQELEYLVPYYDTARQLLKNGCVQVFENLIWHLHLGDFRQQMQRQEIPAPQAIFYDPYSPAKNIEMWTLEHFSQLRQRLHGAAPFLLTNYTRSTVVRVTLLMAGFFVGVGTGVGEKEETTVASNDLKSIEKPLTKQWFERIKISHSSAPLRGGKYAIEPITEGDFSLLRGLPQFQ